MNRSDVFVKAASSQTHDLKPASNIVIRSHNLADVLQHVSSFSVEIVRTMVAQDRSLVPVTEPFIIEIEV